MVKKVIRLKSRERAKIKLDRRMMASSSSRKNGKDLGRNICSIAIDQMKAENCTLTEDDRTSVIHQLKTFYFF